MTDFYAWQQVLDSIETAWPSERYRDVGVVVGCSGGADSVALLRALSELRERGFGERGDRRASPTGFLIVAHFNHRLRGVESDRDQSFVEDLCGELGVAVEVATGSGERHDELSARDDRLGFFKTVLRRYGARYLSLAHSLDDNVETVLYRLMRGTGPAGLTGMAGFRSLSDDIEGADFVVARPLLQCRRDQIRLALSQRGFNWREDASNETTIYDRNWIRNDLVPLIETRFPNAVAAIDRAIDGQTQWADAIEPNVKRWLSETKLSTRPLTFRLCRPDAEHQAVMVEGLRRCWSESNWPLGAMKQSHWKSLVHLLCGRGDDVIVLPGAISALRTDNIVQLTRST